MNKYFQYQSVSIPAVLIKKQKALMINDEELLILIKLFSYNTQYITYNEVIRDFQISRQQLAKLNEKKIISFKEVAENICVDLETVHELLSSQEYNSISTTSGLSAVVLDRISFLLNRSVKPYELEAVKKWISAGHTLDNIETAIQKSIVNGVDNFNYVEKVLNDIENLDKIEQSSIERNVEFY